MKLPIKQKYFIEIKKGIKIFECRDANITFICDETGETIKKLVSASSVVHRPKGFHSDVLEDNFMLLFVLGDIEEISYTLTDKKVFLKNEK